MCKIRKNHLRIIFFLKAIQDLCFKQLTIIQDLEDNNWIILDPLGNIYDIYANLIVMTLFNLATFE